MLYIYHSMYVRRKEIVITDDHLLPFVEGPYLAIPPGEKSKSREMKAFIEDTLFERGYGRDSLIIALGGGVVSDLAGFVAATFCRGVPWIAIPTSLIAMVDASIGGKVGINTPFGKNLIGAFHPPQEVILDFKYLETLPEKEWKNGLAEILKYGIIEDPTLLDNPRSHQSILRSIAIKKKIVAEDPKECGKRRILNFGHTIAHALEKVSNYTIPHGEAVASGMLFAAKLSVRLGYLGASSLQHIEHCLTNYGFTPYPLPQEILFAFLKNDKKSINGNPRFVLLKELGQPLSFEGSYCRTVEPEIIKEILCG